MNNEYYDNRLGGPEKKTALKMVVVIMGFCLVGYIVGPPLYWRVSELLTANIRSSTHRCPPCSCDCSSQQLLLLLDGLSSRSFTDELRLSEEEAQKKQQRADLALLEAKRMTSQYQKEAEKCNFGMDSCEEAREKAEDVVEEQRKLTAIWELRARERGWREGIKRSHANQNLE
uniref:DUF1068 domain-containing protein n=1 Tax=Salix viminalis TaxID=40686 RepID=A0A6N2ND93_SALVM